VVVGAVRLAGGGVVGAIRLAGGGVVVGAIGRRAFGFFLSKSSRDSLCLSQKLLPIPWLFLALCHAEVNIQKKRGTRSTACISGTFCVSRIRCIILSYAPVRLFFVWFYIVKLLTTFLRSLSKVSWMLPWRMAALNVSSSLSIISRTSTGV